MADIVESRAVQITHTILSQRMRTAATLLGIEPSGRDPTFALLALRDLYRLSHDQISEDEQVRQHHIDSGIMPLTMLLEGRSAPHKGVILREVHEASDPALQALRQHEVYLALSTSTNGSHGGKTLLYSAVRLGVLQGDERGIDINAIEDLNVEVIEVDPEEPVFAVFTVDKLPEEV